MMLMNALTSKEGFPIPQPPLTREQVPVPRLSMTKRDDPNSNRRDSDYCHGVGPQGLS
jgi:hypothetical protein